MPTSDPELANANQAKQLDGELVRNTETGLIEQAGYGVWPRCTICQEQVEPVTYNTHYQGHISGARPPQPPPAPVAPAAPAEPEDEGVASLSEV